MGFWLKNIIIALILIVLAIAFFLNKDYFFSLDGSLATEQSEQTDRNSNTNTEKVKSSPSEPPKSKNPQAEKPKNAAAEGLSNFYAKIYGSDIRDKPKIRNNVIFLPEPQGDLVKILQAREVTVRSYKKNWHGTKTSRPFRKGETLYQKLAEYAKNEGLEVIWWLNRDFVIKGQFRINKDILKTAYQIGEAVSGHFPEGISSYYCYRQRAIVFINEAPVYLDKECVSLKPKNAY